MARSNELAVIRTRRGLGVVLALTLIGGIGVIAACKSATYIDVKVSGDSTLCTVQTAKPTRFTLYSRKPGPIVDGEDGQGPDGDLATCNPKEVRTFYFGNFTVDPVEGKSDAVVVEMRVNTSGASSGDGCNADDKGKIPNTCVVVRRKLRFDPGRRLELSMYLDDRCLGVSCEQDKSCFRGGCVSADVVCDAAGCLTEAERAAGAGFDPSRPANLPPGAIGTDDAGRTVYVDGAVVDDAGRIHLDDGAVVQPDGAVTTEDGALPPPDTGLPDSSTGIDSSFPPPDAGSDADAGLGGYVNPSCSICTVGGQQCCAANGTMGPFACRPVCAPSESTCMIQALPDGGSKVNCALGIE